ncbi:MAG TPA: serine/threonine-protein kinase, partial [Prosthecobacter sp.]|nr:serine/threonine-protein kinase [Prosthecobacter sp.]
MEQPLHVARDAAAAEVSPELAGGRIDQYTIVRELGEGGYGVVYLAEQHEPIRRQVALKVIKVGMDTRAMVARFEAERQMLAMLDHPGIAKILDAGSTDTGAPFYAMELVEGVRITDFCRQHRLSIETCLTLMIQVAHAVQHAHQRGIIHRDLKPSNILVTMRSGKPLPKVIDFGIAKATRPGLGEQTLTTDGQVLGTPAYMSPEQLESDGRDIDIRTDVFSLGVILHELLTGRAPLRPRDDETLEKFRRRAVTYAPRKPSTTLQALPPAEQRQLVEGRHTTFQALLAALRGDLDSILLMALAPDRSRRYESAAAFARDLERFLRREPVEAHAPGAIYQLGKFAQRHRALTAATGGILAVGVIAGTLIFSAWRKEQAALRQVAQANDSLRVHLYSSDMQLASQAYAAGDIGRLRALLAPHAERFSGRLEWRLFSQLARGEELWNRKVDDGFASGLGFLSDDRIIVLGGNSHSLFRVLDARTGELLESFGQPGVAPVNLRIAR